MYRQARWPWRVVATATALTVLALAPAASQAQGVLPPEIEAALALAKLPRDAISIVVLDTAAPPAKARLSWRAEQAVNPASVMKLVTTYAALELLGPAYTWNTAVYVDGPVQGGTLKGNLYLQGQGDPKLVLERLWLLLRRVRALGIQQIGGNIVLDRSAMDVPESDPAAFDGEPYRPQNAAPDALLLNFKSLVLSFTPDRAGNAVRVSADLPLAGVQLPSSVPLLAGECGDYRSALKPDFSDPRSIRFGGGYAAACGEKLWPVAYADPNSFALRAVEGLWLEQGGKLTGKVRYGAVPAGLRPAFEQASSPLADLVRDINKYSNNVMAQQLFLSLSLPTRGPAPLAATAPASFEASRQVLQRWWQERWPLAAPPLLDNGSGLSRQERVQAQALAAMLHGAFRSAVMPELMASLPIAGVDGTLRRSRLRGGGAHLKTGSLRDVSAIAGYVLGNSGRQQVLVAIVNHASLAQAARPVFDALVEWAQADGAAPL